MDRIITQPFAIPLDSDLLNAQRNAMLSDGWFMSMVMGSATAVEGLGCIPTAPPSMAVQINPGMLCQGSTIDTTQFGSLPLGTDNVSPLVKAGILPAYDATTMLFTLAAPTVSGQSINYLIEASLLEVDDLPLVLPYYNAANPLQALLGPNGSGTDVFTRRRQKVQLQLKAGVPAVDGFQTTPAADAGWVPLWIVTVKFGDTSIDSSRIVKSPSAPFIVNKLPQLQPLLGGRIRRVLATNLNIYVSPTGSDSNDGQTPATPFGTLQHCWDYIQGTLDLNNFGVTINMANGTYTSGVACAGAPTGTGNGSFITFKGNVSSPSSVVVSVTNQACFGVNELAVICLQGMTITAPSGTSFAYSTSGVGIQVNDLGAISLVGAIVFGPCTFAHMDLGSGGIVEAQGTSGNTSTTAYTISGGAQYHIVINQMGQLYMPYVPISITGTPSFSGAFISVNFGWANFIGTTWNGTSTGTGLATGVRYSISGAGQVYTNGAGANFLPGTSAGATAAGGNYF